MIGTSHNSTFRIEGIQGVWHVAYTVPGSDFWEHALHKDLETAMQSAVDAWRIRHQGRSAFQPKNARNDAVKLWQSIRRLRAVLERVS